MTDETAQQRAIETFLRRNVASGTKNLADLEALSLQAFAAMADGTTAVEVTFEGGATRAQINCPPHILLAACETVHAETDPANTLSNATLANRYGAFDGGRIET